MKLDLRFVEVSLEDLWCEAVAALVFEEPYDSQGTIFTLNTRTGGYLSLLRESGFFQGSLGSTILLASEGRVKADKIVLKGLGPKADCSPEAFVRCVEELGDSLARLKVRDLAVWIPLPQNLERDPSGFFCDACMTLLRSYEKRYGMDPGFYLKTVFSFPHELLGFMEDIAGSLKNAFRHLEGCSVITVEKEQ
ncbi:MAG: hypothetical protein JRI80_07150 [Deltaproteobacteria bacterium]|nr:hypothetical protein [Deltaproteobacteria bacterium]